MSVIKKHLKSIITIILFMLSIISYSKNDTNKPKYDASKYEVYDPNEKSKSVEQIEQENKIKETLIYNNKKADEILSHKAWVQGKALATQKWSIWFKDSILIHYMKSFRYKTNIIINNLINANKGQLIEYNGNKFVDNNMDGILNLKDGISDINLIRLIYNTYYNEENILNYNTLDELYVGMLDQFGQRVENEWWNSEWEGEVPKNSRLWKIDGKYITRKDLNPIDLSKLNYYAHYPYELNENSYNSIQTGDIIVVDLFDDGKIDFSGIAFIPENTFKNTIVEKKDEMFAVSKALMKIPLENDILTDQWIYPVQNIKLGSGYYEVGHIPMTTTQMISTKSVTSTGETIENQEKVVNRVVVIPSTMIMDSIWSFSKPLSYVEDLDPDLKWRLKQGKYIENIKVNDGIQYNTVKHFKQDKSFKASYKIWNKKVSVNEEHVKDIQEKNVAKDASAFSPFQEDGGVNSTLNEIISTFIDSFSILPKILMVLIGAIFIIDLMFGALKEIKYINQGIGTFMSMVFDKTTRYAMIIVLLLTYGEFLTRVFYPLVISRLPVYLLGLADTYAHLDITNTNVDGDILLSFGKIWGAVMNSVVYTIMSIMSGRVWVAVFTIIFLTMSLFVAPIWTVRTILIRTLVIPVIIVIIVLSAFIAAINIVANLFMSAIFMVIVTTIASIYFIFGVSDVYIDKFMLIIKILMVTMIQYLVQIVLLVITLTTLNQMGELVKVNSIGGLNDILPTILVLMMIVVILKVPTKISRTLEQAI